MTLASSRKSAGFDSMDVLFFIFGRISHHMNPPPFHRSRSLDLTTDYLVLPTDIWQHGPDSQPGTTASFTAKRGNMDRRRDRTGPPGRLSTPCTSQSRVQVIISLVYVFRHRSIPIPPCQIVLHIRSTTSLHPSRPTRAFRHYRPTSPPSLRARK